MPPTEASAPLSLYRPQAATESFARYCAEERKRRENSGEAFDTALFGQAVELALGKLRVLEQEGRA